MPSCKTAKAPKGRTIPAQGNALGIPPRLDASPEGAAHLPDGWRWVTLREIAEISGGVTKGQKRKPHDVVRSVPYLRVANVQRGYIDLTEVKEIQVTEREIQAHTLLPGDILFNEGGDRDKLGRGWVWNGEIKECVHQNHVFRARLRNPDDSPKFVSYYGNSGGKQYFFDQGKHTTNLASINLTKLGGLPIPFPPPEVQHRIVAEIEKQFTRLDAGVAALRRAQANLKRYRAAVLKAACEGRLVPSKACRSESQEGHGSSEPLPEGWQWTTVAEICDAVVDCHNKTAPYTESGVPLVRTTNIRGGRICLENTRFVDEPTYEFWSRRCMPKPGDVLFTREAPMGEAGIIPDGVTLCMGQRIMLLRPSPKIFNRYLLIALLAPGLFNHITKTAVGSGVQHLRVRDVEALPIPLPTLAEQTRIVAEVERRLSVVEELEAAVTCNLQRATRLRQSVLQKAFTGEL